MRGDELAGLRKQRQLEGFSNKEINEEINNLVGSQIVLKNNKKEIKHLIKDNEKLTDQNEKLKSKVFNLQFQLDSTKGEPIIREETESDIPILRRIMILLKCGEPVDEKKLSEDVGITPKKLSKCAEFLEKYNLIRTKVKDKIRSYSR